MTLSIQWVMDAAQLADERESIKSTGVENVRAANG